MFLHLSVSHSIHRTVSAPVHAGIHNPCWADTPTGQTPPLGRHLQADTPGQTPPGQTPPAQCMLGYTPCAQCMLGYGQQADGMHPTGMHYCLNKFLKTIRRT